MKAVSTLLVLMALVSAFSVRGWAGQSIPGTSAAFEHCADRGSRSSNRCRPVMYVVAAADEVGAFSETSSTGTVGGSADGTGQDQNLATPEFLREIAVLAPGVPTLANELLRGLVDYFMGGDAPAVHDAVARPTLFDPI